MARFQFTKDYDYKPTEQSTIGYKAGSELTVKQDCAEKAEAAGAGVWIDKPSEEPAAKSSKRSGKAGVSAQAPSDAQPDAAANAAVADAVAAE